ncbi:hypothetical protein SAY87_026850 [Trapa incisa]|uniref:Transmembrane protein n=1 Tax=Trapa incisa TaxID=236973 RepID=A0AAN7GQV8_9MYRT|nr:hypothetical protein SAY87_026850 [Trapa incisa]
MLLVLRIPMAMLVFSSSQLHCPSSRFAIHFRKLSPLRNRGYPLPAVDFHFHVINRRSQLRWPCGLATGKCDVRAYSRDGSVYGEIRNAPAPSNFGADSFLSVVESICLVSSAAASVVLAVRKSLFGGLGDRILVWVVVVLICGVAVGSLIRMRQWRFFNLSVNSGGRDLNLVERVEKLEEDVRSSATIIRALSRQLEKLGIRFRLTRKALKEPIAETAALAQKNSEATRILAEQEDILEKELGEIQKVLLAMQEQQQKQLELILAIGKSSKLWESRRDPVQRQDTGEVLGSIEDGKPIEVRQT